MKDRLHIETKSTTCSKPNDLGQYSRLVFLFKDSCLYGGMIALTPVVALVTFPLLTRHFTVSEFGILDLLLVLSGNLSTFLIFGQDSAVARYFYEQDDTNYRRQIISQSLTWQFAWTAVILSAFWCGLPLFLKYLPDMENLERCLLLVFAQLPFQAVLGVSQNLLKWSFQRGSFVFLAIGSAMFRGMLLVVAVVIFNSDIEGILLVGLVTNALFATLGLLFIRNWLVWPDDFSYLKKLLVYAIPIGIIGCLGPFVPVIERSMALDILGPDALGNYAVGARLAMLTSLLINAFQTAWGPFSLSIFKEQNAATTYNLVLKLFSLVMCLWVLAAAAFGESLTVLLASSKYTQASTVIFPLTLALAVQAVGWITQIGISFSKRSHLNFYSTLMYVCGTICGMFFLAPRLGLIGIALAVLIGQSARTIAASWLAAKVYPLNFQYHIPLWIMGFAATWGFGMFFLGKNGAPNLVLPVVAVGVIIILGVFWRFLMEDKERQHCTLLINNLVCAINRVTK